MLTPWGEQLNKNQPLNEYPRPQLVRDSYLCLNGAWRCKITASNPESCVFDGEITVPFSPESELSGVNRILMPEEILHYQKEFTLPEGFVKPDYRVLLHFGAVDQLCEVKLNDSIVCAHTGGYTSFSCDITDKLSETNVLSLTVRDYTDTSYHSRGKQSLNPGGIWYTPQSGIWQSVWLEAVPKAYIERLEITPDFDNSCVYVLVKSNQTLSAELTFGETVVCGYSNETIKAELTDFIPWSPENPFLYGLSVKMGEDSVTSYFGMRKFEVKEAADGHKRFFLNNKPYFLSGLLDQGYWPDGLYTAPSEEALIYDISLAKEMGYNLLRKHIKIEPMRWYYHCDRIGMIVWQDMPNGGGKYNKLNITHPLFTNLSSDDGNYKLFSRSDKAGREQYYSELNEMLMQLYNTVCISAWVPFNEGWGQFDADVALSLIRNADPTRTVDHASGWHDRHIGDYYSRHVYFIKYRDRKDKFKRAKALTEFGGYKFAISGHTPETKEFGYKTTKSDEDFKAEFKKLYIEEILPNVEKGLSVCIYTQLSDVEGEINGLVTYDRKKVKLESAFVKSINNLLINAGNKE